MTHLLVDDDAPMRNTLEQALTRRGAQVPGCSDRSRWNSRRRLQGKTGLRHRHRCGADPLARVHAQRARPVSGSGLGLAICQEIVRALGGSVTLENRVIQGHFAGLNATVRLPLAHNDP